MRNYPPLGKVHLACVKRRSSTPNPRRKIMTTPTNRVAIVTGASGVIGAAVAERLAKDGCTVVVNDVGNRASAATVVARIEAAGGRAVAAQADISDVAAVARMFDSTETAFGGVDVLINNAVNLKGTFNTLREAARRLRDGGRIVNFSSSVASLLQPTYGVYAATKAAVEAMTSILAKELRGRNITVNAIAPGPTATKLFLDGKPQEVIDRLSKLAPLEWLGQPRDIADAVAFIAGPDGAWINGQTLRANGGII